MKVKNNDNQDGFPILDDALVGRDELAELTGFPVEQIADPFDDEDDGVDKADQNEPTRRVGYRQQLISSVDHCD